jgi:phage portal protein BeeE
MKLLGWTTRNKQAEKALQPVDNRGGWFSLIREPWTGAWQRNVPPIGVDTALTYSAVFRCISLISSDIAKMRVRLVRLTEAGVWEETENAAFSPVLRKPNRWQTPIQSSPIGSRANWFSETPTFSRSAVRVRS